MYHQQAMVVDFLLPKKRRKTNPVDVGSYLGNLFAVLPLVRYYWATFCQRQFRGFRASLVFTVPTSPPSQVAAQFVSLFLTSVSILSLGRHTTWFSRIFTRNRDQWSVPRARINCRRRASGVSASERTDRTHTGFPGFLHRRNNRFLLWRSFTHRRHRCCCRQKFVAVRKTSSVVGNLLPVFLLSKLS